MLNQIQKSGGCAFGTVFLVVFASAGMLLGGLGIKDMDCEQAGNDYNNCYMDLESGNCYPLISPPETCKRITGQPEGAIFCVEMPGGLCDPADAPDIQARQFTGNCKAVGERECGCDVGHEWKWVWLTSCVLYAFGPF
jgi:hypothetical protein